MNICIPHNTVSIIIKLNNKTVYKSEDLIFFVWPVRNTILKLVMEPQIQSVTQLIGRDLSFTHWLSVVP